MLELYVIFRIRQWQYFLSYEITYLLAMRLFHKPSHGNFISPCLSPAFVFDMQSYYNLNHDHMHLMLKGSQRH